MALKNKDILTDTKDQMEMESVGQDGLSGWVLQDCKQSSSWDDRESPGGEDVGMLCMGVLCIRTPGRTDMSLNC
jgi:hypothetical protein